MRTKNQILLSVLSLGALGAYVFLLYYYNTYLLGYAFHPQLEPRWPALVSVALRWVPVVILVWMWQRPVDLYRFGRVVAVAIGIVAIASSFFLVCFSAGKVAGFSRYFFESTLDLWPWIVLVLTVKSRSRRVLAGGLENRY